MILIPNDLAPNPSRQIFAAVVTVLTALGLLIFGVLGLVDPEALAPGGGVEAAATFAGYMAVRNLVMAAAAILLLALRSWRALALVLILNGAIQTCDTVLGIIHGEVAATVAPAVIAAVLFAAATVLVRSESVFRTGNLGEVGRTSPT